MSTSKALQKKILARLLLSNTYQRGDGVATEFVLEHDLGLFGLPAVTVRAGATLLEPGEDYDLEMIDNNTVKVIALGAPPAMNAWTITVGSVRVKTQSGEPKTWSADAVPIIMRRPKDIANEIEAAAAKHGLGLYIMPALPLQVMEGVPFVFVEVAEIAVRIIEQPSANKFAATSYDLIDDIMVALQWQMLGGDILAHPLMVAQRATETAEDRTWTIIDVRFTAIYQFKKPPET